MARILWNALALVAIFALVYWQAGLFAAAVSVIVAALVSLAFNAARPA